MHENLFNCRSIFENFNWQLVSVVIPTAFQYELFDGSVHLVTVMRLISSYVI